MVTIKTVALAGATGNLGPSVLDALVASGQFTITVLKRAGSTSTIPHPVKVIEVDYTSLDSLTAAVRGQDAVISNLSFSSPEAQLLLLEASVSAGVKRFLPSEFGSAMNAATSRLPVFGSKIAVQKRVEALAQEGKITYTYVFNGAFFDWGLKIGFILDMSEYKPKIFDGGDPLFSTTSTTTVGKALVGVLSHYEETKNRPVYIQDTITSQNKLLAIAKKLTPGKKWEPVAVDLAETKAKADANVAKGIMGMEEIYTYLYVSSFSKDEAYGAHFKKLDNELLGIKEMTDEEIEATVKAYLPKN